MKAWILQHPVSATALASTLLFAVVATGLYATTPPPREHVITLSAKRFQYSPSIIEVNRGDKVTIRLLSTDVHHGFFLDGYEQEMSARPGMDGSVSFVADKMGRYAFRCSMTCGSFHPYMIGHLRVKPDLRLLAALWAFSSLLAIALVSLRVRNGAAQPAGGNAGTQETQP